MSLFAAEFEEPKIVIWGKGLRAAYKIRAIAAFIEKVKVSTLWYKNFIFMWMQFEPKMIVEKDALLETIAPFSTAILHSWKLVNTFPNETLLNWKSVQTTISNLMKMAESSPDG